MQEEVEHRIVVLIEGCAKLSERELRQALAKLMQEIQKKQQTGKSAPSGRGGTTDSRAYCG